MNAFILPWKRVCQDHALTIFLKYTYLRANLVSPSYTRIYALLTAGANSLSTSYYLVRNQWDTLFHVRVHVYSILLINVHAIIYESSYLYTSEVAKIPTHEGSSCMRTRLLSLTFSVWHHNYTPPWKHLRAPFRMHETIYDLYIA